jgi:hypothetical protein
MSDCVADTPLVFDAGTLTEPDSPAARVCASLLASAVRAVVATLVK